ncbi:zf-DHHC-domain-containing protein [Viridothelium virens]|uniref:Palmitoyltransferase n=1 Tax=Viridothelium virens TaxID=1048519 RepID=A0A6A6HPN1_VIRVR|nr:zf-DHHC-domain-containing protein [Viridothelium virens]
MVGKVGKIAIAVGFISFFTFVSFFGRLPALRNTPIGALYRLIWIYIPRALAALDARVTGGNISRYLARTSTYLLHEKHPLVLILFLGLITVCSILFLYSALPLLSVAQFLPVSILLPAPYYFTYLCARSSSSLIIESNHDQHLHEYPYDYVLYHPHKTCRTCLLSKPARSKHCSICRACVAKCDHHCIWVNNCLGKENYRWFLILLLSVGVLELYGSWLAWSVLSPRLQYRASVYDAPSAPSLWTRFIYLIIETVSIGGFSVTGVGLLALLTAPLPLALLLYHLYLIWTGMTTNETVKWSDWREDMADGVVFKAKRSEAVAINGPSGLPQRPDTKFYGENPSLDEVHVDWPVGSDQLLVRTIRGQPPGASEAQSNIWKRCWRLNDVDNIYDLGFWDNLLDVLRG